MLFVSDPVDCNKLFESQLHLYPIAKILFLIQDCTCFTHTDSSTCFLPPSFANKHVLYT